MELSVGIVRFAVNYIKTMTDHGFTDEEILGGLKEQLCEVEDKHGNVITENQLDRLCGRIYDKALEEMYLEGCI